MNCVAFVFTHGPHGSAAGREGLDALLTTSVLAKDISAFFIADGVLILLDQQQPAHILARDFVATFGILSLYDMDRIYLCAESAAERGLGTDSGWVLNAKWLSAVEWRQRLTVCDIVLTF